MNPDKFNPNIAHIKDGDNVFQVLNEDGTDWNEAATQAEYQTWLTQVRGIS